MALCIGFLSDAMPRAEMAGDEYASERILRSPNQREAARRAIEEERRAAESRERERAELQRRLAEEQERMAAMRPLGERLVERHCVACHTLEPVLAVRHSRFGWWVTVARMRWWNGAEIPNGAMPQIVNHLHAVRPAGRRRSLGEYTAAAALICSPVALILYLHLRQRRIRRPRAESSRA